MACRMGFIGCMCMVVVAALLQGATAATYIVGDDKGWKVPDSTDFYTTWTTNKTFQAGDILEFDFTTNEHDVARVTKANYDSCTKTPIGSINQTGPANITLGNEPNYYYICTIGSHCQNGQKLAITVSGSSTSTNNTSTPTASPTPTPTPTTTTSTPPPPPSSASSLAVGGFSAVLFSLAIAFLH
uniref:Phytocyanin domain-containing protein n=1 Tax=Nelumbo nucifera TaxID=4432 RepID=A0A822ZII3_NELNU|nr:TPA_asm: hypothetical protein HUJ06_003172 [Nelumbo nucifera]